MSTKDKFETDVIPTSEGDLTITFLGHASLRFTFGGKEIYADPFGKRTDYSKLPAADVILITHEHGDHCDPQAIAAVRTETTQLILTAASARQLKGGFVMHNGDSRSIGGLNVEAAAAYNLVHKRETGQPFHIRGEGNGYIIPFGDKRVYIAGDTENIPEMKNLGDIDIAFLPVNLPYTMSPEMAADAAKMIRPRILYPYHYSQTDLSRLVKLLENEKGIEVRIRRMA